MRNLPRRRVVLPRREPITLQSQVVTCIGFELHGFGMVAWIVSLILYLHGAVAASTAHQIAESIDAAAEARPLYRGDFAVERTIAELVAIAHREGHFEINAIGSDGFGESYGLYQIHETNLKRLGITREEALSDPKAQTEAALTLLRESHRVCHNVPLEEQLAHYASGRGRCDIPEAVADSRNRMQLALRLFARRPRWIERHEHLTKRCQDRTVDTAKNPE